MDIKTVLFVCTGNTCRSPMAEAIFRQEAARRDLAIEVFSRGLSALFNQPISSGAAQALQQAGLSLPDHRARPLERDHVKKADLILTMEGAQKDIIVREYPLLARLKTFTFKEYIGNEGDVADPIGKPLPEYVACREELSGLIQKLFQKLAPAAEGSRPS